ncbi:hypothetical protein [Nocardia abscessus]|uniref:hypothetical protein n=1 Tax=Nocardia abscessus TaxID=120957 RepID=UPI001D139704|nr:hypothetical protein [Nocardia abscessus]MCC3333507.1 hypothetical protein [Nocardia abscessus]
MRRRVRRPALHELAYQSITSADRAAAGSGTGSRDTYWVIQRRLPEYNRLPQTAS